MGSLKNMGNAGRRCRWDYQLDGGRLIRSWEKEEVSLAEQAASNGAPPSRVEAGDRE